MADIERQQFFAAHCVAHVKFMRADDITFAADAE